LLAGEEREKRSCAKRKGHFLGKVHKEMEGRTDEFLFTQLG
jgi:hypothetical protein